MSSSRSRLVDLSVRELSRRDVMRRALALGAVVAVPSVLAACGGSSDADVIESGSSDTTATPATTATGDAGTAATTATPTTVAADTSATTAAASPTGDALPAGASLTIDFTFTPDGGGRVRNPYIAVWIEDTDGALVKPIAVWYREREAKYLNKLSRWATVDGSDTTLETVSSATKPAGSYSLAWDGTDVAGAAVAQGDYVVCVEAAREHGPYELVSAPVTLGTEGFTADLGADSELTAVAVTYAV
ncbi:MAG: DUF2271 domain-containing protein [Acidimicrobiales bacterium]